MISLRINRSLSVAVVAFCATAPLWLSTPAHAEEDHHPGDGHKHSQRAIPKENERAIGLHKAIVALDPTDTESYSVAAWLLWSMEKGPEAIAHIERGLKANSTNWEMWDAAGQHYDLQKRATPAMAEKAKEAYINALKFLPEDADKGEAQMLRRRLAHAAEKAGDLRLSQQTWRDLVRDYPDDAVNKNNMERVDKLAGTRTASLPVALGGTLLLALAGSNFLRQRKTG
jgi:tetratricopeptide (TPR) repeat protein